MQLWKWLKCAAVMSLLACALISTSAASADLVRLADILAPVLTARQFAVLCRAADPNFDDVRASLGTVQTYSRHMRDEILDGLPQDQAGVVLTSAADRARSTARERLHAFASSPNEVNASALANWCRGSARLYIRTVLAGHDNERRLRQHDPLGQAESLTRLDGSKAAQGEDKNPQKQKGRTACIHIRPAPGSIRIFFSATGTIGTSAGQCSWSLSQQQ
jgi:hypothetical protein